MRPTPFQAYRPHHDRLRQVLHLLHRAQRPRAGAEPAAGAHRRRGPAARRRGLQGNHAPRPDGQQLQVPRARRPDRTALRSARPASTTLPGIERIKFVTNFPKDMTDDLLAGRARPAEGLPLSARAGPERLRRGAQADEAALHGRVLPRDAGPLPRDGAGRGGHQRLHRRLLRRDRGVVREDVRPGRARRGSRTASSSSTARGPARRPTSCTPTTCPRRSRSAATTTCWRCRTPSACEDNRRLIGRDDDSPGRRAAAGRRPGVRAGTVSTSSRGGPRATGSSSSRGRSV